MSKTFLSKNYQSLLSILETQNAIELIKRTFEKNITHRLNLQRVSAPLFVKSDSGLNDDLNGIERTVSFDITESGETVQIVQSLAKWKRYALFDYQFKYGTGLYTNMNAIREDETLDNIHSVYVDQWDWEKIITADERNLSYLKQTVDIIAECIVDTANLVKKNYPVIDLNLPKVVNYITSQELEDMYPFLTPKEREIEYSKKFKCVFIMQIGDILKSGIKHDGRAADYDDWKFNGDLIYWNDVLQNKFELSSMGIRVDAKSLDYQLKKSGCEERKNFPFHQAVLNNELPLTIGGGIGQSRLCMLLLKKIHIGEVQVSVWDNETFSKCTDANIKLL